jgi:hypothetical protein
MFSWLIMCVNSIHGLLHHMLLGNAARDRYMVPPSSWSNHTHQRHNPTTPQYSNPRIELTSETDLLN